MKVLSVFGTRPEAIKMAPVVNALDCSVGIDARVCVTAQHRHMLDQVLELFKITPHYDLDIMRPNQGLAEVASSIISAMDKVLADWNPDIVLVHGDTTTAMAAALASYHRRIPVGHVEAGLRTRDIYSPWPEEVNRRIVGVIASLHFAPTEGARQNLISEGISPSSVRVTGNTVIDAVLGMRSRLESESDLRESVDSQLPPLASSKRLILVTGHRRENFGEGFAQICTAIERLALRGDTEVVYPVHMNPNVSEPVFERLMGIQGVHLIPPLEYAAFVRLMHRAELILTDSGGVQEEAPSFGVPVLVMRDTTERPEAVAAGTVKLVGAVADRIVEAASLLLDNEQCYAQMARAMNPYGDGKAALRIIDWIREVSLTSGSSFCRDRKESSCSRGS